MVEINIAKEFSITPGARTYADGANSGQEFFEKLLKPKFIQAVEENTKLKIILDGTEGYASSFLNEAFSLLGTEFGAEQSWERLIIISNEVPKYALKVKNSVHEKRK